MNKVDTYYITHKKQKLFIYLIFYLIIFLTGVFYLKNAIKGSLLHEDISTEIIIGKSIGLSLITISTGFLFFLGYDFLERKVFNVIGIFIIIILTIIHFLYNCFVGILTLEGFLLGCPAGYGWSFGLACASHLYVFVVRRIYRATNENYVSESKKLLIQILLPFACFLIMAVFIRFSLGILAMFVVGFIFMDGKSFRRR